MALPGSCATLSCSPGLEIDVYSPLRAMPPTGPGSIAFGDQAPCGVFGPPGDDPYRFRPTGGETARTAPIGHPTGIPQGCAVGQPGRPQPPDRR